MIRAGGITGAVNHAIRQSVRAASVSQSERKPLWGLTSATGSERLGYNPNSAFALPPAIAARSASVNEATDAMCPSGSYSAMS